MLQQKNYASCWSEIDLSALRHNFQLAKKFAQKNCRGAKNSGILAVVKADAYGHGMVPVAKELNRLGVEFFGVSNVGEGITLRQAGIKHPILLFENPLPDFANQIVEYKLTPMLCTLELATALNAAARRAGKKVDVHIKVDTAMGRLGVWHEDALDFVRRVRMLSHLRITGLATHFPVADTDQKFTRRQFLLFQSLVSSLQSLVHPDLIVHASNSAGLCLHKNQICNLARPGLMLYGLYPSESLTRRIKLKPVMSIKTRIIFLKKITPGRSVSYGRTFIAKRPMTVATLPIGYSDGFFRCLSNKAEVLIGGKRCRQLGRVTMDQIVVDVSNVKNVKLGQEAVIVGRQGKEVITAEDVANWAGTINYEVVCNLGNRMIRKYYK